MNILDHYKTIGVDLDGTLFDHDNSWVLARYIRDNRLDQEFVIVTHRSHGMEREIDRDLASYGLSRHHFMRVCNVPDPMFEAYHIGGRTGDQRAIDAYLNWKGMTCFEHGVEILIDDMADLVKAGCDLHGIAYIHPDDLVTD